MKKFRAAAALLAALCLLLSCTAGAFAAETYQVQVKAEFKYTETRKMLDLVNKFRTGKNAWHLAEDNRTRIEVKGLKKLEYDTNLERAAMQRALEIAAYFSHTRPDGSAWSAAFPNGYSTRGENICYGYGSAESAFKAFAEEDEDYSGQGHRRNMLRKEFTRVGFGCVKVGNVVYWAQAFGSGGSSSNGGARFSASQVRVSADVMAQTARSIAPELESLDLRVGESVSMPNIVISSNTGAKLTLAGQEWKSLGSAVKVSGKKLTGVSQGSATLETKFGGQALRLPVSVSGGGSSRRPSEEDVTEFIDDYDPALAAEYIVVLEDDECFEID